ncbi:hypothetical protein [Paenibacillus sp. NPDC057934]|uniref:hypothetical protein n=1 Tax=Paenibacillus sp. NPDC057934 TaxID=3346282 RepID=UPI0036DBD93B
MSEIERLIADAKLKANTIKENYKIALLTNTRSKTRTINNEVISYSPNNEFFSDEEYNEVLEGIQSADYYVEPFFNEIEFIMDALVNANEKNDKWVYNLSRNGNFTGKKSLVPSFCDLLSIPYTGSNAFVISFSRAKYIYTKYIEKHNISVPRSWVYSASNGWLHQSKPPFGTKIIIKPMHESASIGLSNSSISIYDTNTEKQFDEQISNNSEMLVQEFIQGFECEVPLLISTKPYALDPVGISIDGQTQLDDLILTHERSFNDLYDFYPLEQQLHKSKVEAIKTTAVQISSLLGLRNYGRVDFRINHQGVPFLMDIAASPYTTKHSSFAFSFDKLGLNYYEIYNAIIGLSAADNSLVL